jgi:hypothetical protein
VEESGGGLSCGKVMTRARRDGPSSTARARRLGGAWIALQRLNLFRQPPVLFFQALDFGFEALHFLALATQAR